MNEATGLLCRSLRAALPELLLTLLCSAPATASGATDLPEPLSLEWCLERAAGANPELRAEAAVADAASHRIRPAGALEDPRFSYEASNLPIGDFDFDSTPLSGHQLRLAQKVPFPGLLRSRRDAARSQAEAAELSLEDERRRVAADVETSWAALAFAQRALGITDRNIELLRQLTAIAEAKYRVGTGLQQDVLRAQVELTALLQERLRRQASIQTAAASLAALLDLPADASFPAIASLDEDSLLPELSVLAERVETSSQRLRALAAEVEASRRRLRAAELEGYPDFDFGLGYRIRQNVVGDPVAGDDFLSAGVVVTLPINRARWRAHVAEQSALLRRAEARYRAEKAGLGARIRAAHAELTRADAESVLLETGLLPQARQSLESSRSGYEVGRIDFLSLLHSQVRMLNAELRWVRAVADRRVAFARLEAAVGEVLR